MKGRERTRSSRAGRMVLISLVAVGALCLLAPAAGAKGKTATRLASVAIAPGTQQAVTTTCVGKSHITGGGWSVAPTYSANGQNAPNAGSGTRVNHLQSQPSGAKSWIASVAAFTAPAQAGTLTGIARCESNSLGKLAGTISGSSTIPISQSTTVDAHCPQGTHVLNGGFSASPPGNLANPAVPRLLVTESRRTDTQTWQVQVVNPLGSGGVATLFTSALCERNAKGASLSEASAAAPIVDNGRTVATASCTGKKHTTGGGFQVSPVANTAPAVGIDQMQPAGQKAWQVGSYEYPGFVLPAGSFLTAYSYCKKNAK
jgi:hypothetical protein